MSGQYALRRKRYPLFSSMNDSREKLRFRPSTSGLKPSPNRPWQYFGEAFGHLLCLFSRIEIRDMRL